MLSESYMTKITQKTNEPYTWDINGEDYWIINEDMYEQERNALLVNRSCITEYSA